MGSHRDWVVPESLDEIGIERDRLTDFDAPKPTMAKDIHGQDEGVGTFAEGALRLENDRYILKGASTEGQRLGTVVFEVIFEGNDISPHTSVAPEFLDVSGYDYKLSDGELHLRRRPKVA